MFVIVKGGKGKIYRTECPKRALQAYTHKRAVSIWYNDNIVLTKCTKNAGYTQARVWSYIERYCVKGGK